MSAGYADTVARISNTLAAYAHAVDDGRTEDVIATFVPQGRSVLPGHEPIEGHAALQEAYAALVPTAPQRHVLSNIEVVEIGDGIATVVSDLVVLGKRDRRWAVMFLGRYTDHLRADGDRWLFESRELTLE